MKKLAFRDGCNNYYTLDPRWFKIFAVLFVILLVLVILMGVVIVAGIVWIDHLDIVSRLFALLEARA